MADQETMLAQTLGNYIDKVREAVGVEERRLHLIDLVRTFLDRSATDFEVETYSGRRFVLLSNLVLEVKANLHWHLSDEELKTKHYITDLNSRKPQTNYVTIVTDGLHFHTCIPRYDETGRVVELEKVCGLNLDSPMSTLENAAQDLKMILSDFFQEQR